MCDDIGIGARGAKSAPFKTDNRFRPTKTGVIGVQRETMLQNELHYLVRHIDIA